MDGFELSADAYRELDEAGFTIIPGPVPTQDLAELSAAYDAVISNADPGEVTAQLYHEQRKFAQALLYYRKAISAARRAVMNEDFRAFVQHWLRVEMKLCKHSVG
jgi:hypothetical protein